MVNVFPNGFAVDAKCVRDVVDRVIKQHGVTGNYEVNVNFVTEQEMSRLHDKKPHEVLSFPLIDPSTGSGRFAAGPDGITRLGDIVVLGKLPPQKRDLWIAHACLHLLGIHHE